MNEYLTTKELAALLRIKERKVYDLAASGRVPCSKAMGKLLFPRAEIEAWLAAERTGPEPRGGSAPLPQVVLGSHDPLLDWALRESGSGLATYFDGSTDGLERFQRREGIAAGLHVHDPSCDDWNTPAVLGSCANLPVVVVEWARRRRGLVLASGLKRKVRDVAGLGGLRFAARQAGSGTQLLFEELAKRAGVEADRIDVVLRARNESDAVLAVAEGKADACFGLESLAAQSKLAFVPVVTERFDLLVDRRSWFEPQMQAFVGFCQGEAFHRRAAEFAGYDVGGFGTVHFNGP